MSAAGFQMPEMYEGKPYNRAVYLELKELVERQQRAMNDTNSAFTKMSPPPPDRAFIYAFRDNQQYVEKYRDQFERETAALVVSARGDECFLSPARCTANSATISYHEYLKSLARTGTTGLTAFLARRLMSPVLDTMFSRNSKVTANAERKIMASQGSVFKHRARVLGEVNYHKKDTIKK